MTEDSEILIDGPEVAAWTLVLAHGAGQGMRSPFMAWFADRLSGNGIRVVRFEFPYMQAMSAGGKRRPPNPQPRLLDTWRALLARLEARGTDRDRTLIGGKSMGGRMASLIAEDAAIAGLVCLGYPFHPPGRPESIRTAHLTSLHTPTLICQGERDTFGAQGEVSRYSLSPAIRFCWLADGDHGFKPRKASGLTLEDNLKTAAGAISSFVADL